MPYLHETSNQTNPENVVARRVAVVLYAVKWAEAYMVVPMAVETSNQTAPSQNAVNDISESPSQLINNASDNRNTAGQTQVDAETNMTKMADDIRSRLAIIFANQVQPVANNQGETEHDIAA
jgi:hypothetical protein